MQPKIDEIIFSKRKTIALQITSAGKVIVRAPRNVSKKTIDQFIAKKNQWLETKLKLIQQQNDRAIIVKENIINTKILFLGKFYPLKLVDSIDMHSSAIIFVDNEFLLAKEYAYQIDYVIACWYKREARRLITSLGQVLVDKYHFKYRKISVTNAKTRWGSCSSNGNLSFSWRLVMAPLAIIEYVVIHELTHLIHHNHSKNFWNKVKSLLPNYPQCKKWLKDNGYLLTLL